MTLVIDAHLHIFETKDLGRQWKTNYHIWEYGQQEIHYSQYAGDFSDAQAAIADSGFSHAIFANVFFPRVEVDFGVDALGPGAGEHERLEAESTIRATMRERMYERNRWGCEVVAGDSRFSVLAGIDPSVVPPDENVRLVRELVENHQVVGIKIHPVLQEFWPNDPRMTPILALCEELGLVVLSHSGSAKGDKRGAPSSFGPVLEAFPRLKLQVAHLGGGEWREAVELAGTFSQVKFDLCEIIEWVGSPDAPSAAELADMVSDIGANRVLLGTDFPWYDLDRTAQRVADLPKLSRGEKDAILGANAAELYGLAI
jgi:predicted TIM-barrel fold metal-dependent hydrolase